MGTVSEEERRLVRRIRFNIAVIVLGFFLQGAFLATALKSGGSVRDWIAWAVVVIVALGAIVVAAVRASRMSKRCRLLKWGER